jgi:hypothetical protein
LNQYNWIELNRDDQIALKQEDSIALNQDDSITLNQDGHLQAWHWAIPVRDSVFFIKNLLVRIHFIIEMI